MLEFGSDVLRFRFRQLDARVLENCQELEVALRLVRTLLLCKNNNNLVFMLYYLESQAMVAVACLDLAGEFLEGSNVG